MIVTLWQRFSVREKFQKERVTRFVIGRVRFLFFAQRQTAALLPQRTLSRASSSSASVIPFKPRRGSEQRRFVDHIGQLGAGITGVPRATTARSTPSASFTFLA
jgi:hypothetical protein